MRVFDRHGEVCIVSAASLAAGNDDFLIVGARAVYISHSPLTKDQCELLKPGIIARLERMESVDCGRNALAVHVAHLSYLPDRFFVQFMRDRDVCQYTFSLTRDKAELLRDELQQALSGDFIDPLEVS